MSEQGATTTDSGGDVLRRYIVATALPFQELRDTASQLAGLMVLAASGARSATVDHPMLAVGTAARLGVVTLSGLVRSEARLVLADI